LTNDGSFANHVAHPRYETEREYLALLGERPTDAAIEALRRGVILDGRRAAASRVELPGSGFRVPRSALETGARRHNAERPTRNAAPPPPGVWLRIVLREGRNREVRRMLLAVGYPAQRLVRTRIGPVRLGNLRPGAYRELTDVEIRALLAGGSSAKQSGALAGVGPSGHEAASDSSSSIPHPQTSNLQTPTPARLVVAIDGPSGAGKTTVGKRVAERLGADFLDTGVLYRALTLQALEGGVSPADEAGLAGLARQLKVEVRAGPSGEDLVLFDGRDATEAIRSPTVDAFVSQVASHAAVRETLIPAQRRVADAGRAVVAGRDIGTVIFPDAQVKVFLEAVAAERARRRAEQSGDRAAEIAVQHGMEQRDALDRGRSVAPLEPAADAVLIETDGVSIDEVVDRICSLVPVDSLTARG